MAPGIWGPVIAADHRQKPLLQPRTWRQGSRKREGAGASAQM